MGLACAHHSTYFLFLFSYILNATVDAVVVIVAVVVVRTTIKREK